MAKCHVLVLAMSLVVLEAAVLTGKALYCRDPDTGKFHDVNTTWASTTFCGNYTCKLRKRNITETQYTPLRQLNITNINNEIPENDKKENITVTIEQRTEPEIESVIHKDKDNEVDNMGIENHEKQLTDNKEIVVSSKMNDIADINDENRYLNEKEIKSISEILHTIKKSDLNAIVDIYNLAQDIYNEVDGVKIGDSTDDTINAITDEKLLKNPKKTYWYNPKGHKVKIDMDYQGSNNVLTTTQPKSDEPSYFNGALNKQDFGKLPYYYPISEFQRASSYLRQPTAPTKVMRPCKVKQNDMQASQSVMKSSYPYSFAYLRPYNYSDFQNTFYYNNYPGYWDYYNQQRQYQPYYNIYRAPVPLTRAILINPQLHEDVIGVEQMPVRNEHMLVNKPKDNLIPVWKTEQLSKQTIDTVRANIDTSKFLKAFPFRKKIVLDKVGKVIKLDDLDDRQRSKRSFQLVTEKNKVNENTEVTEKNEVNKNTEVTEKNEFNKNTEVTEKNEVNENTEVTENNEVNEATEDLISDGEYEIYLEKTTCQSQVIPGFFRYGNLTRPYPECCPQLINITDKPQ